MEGAKLSVGDLHFSQGDGEISFCGAIEMGGWIEFGVDLIKGGVAQYGMRSPTFMSSPVEPRYSEYLAFTGLSADDEDNDHYLDTTLAYRQACLHAIELPDEVRILGRAGVPALERRTHRSPV